MNLDIMLKYKNKIFKELTGVHDEMDETLIHSGILPFCDKYNLDFVSGMGTFFIENKKGTRIVTKNNSKSNTTFWRAYFFVEKFITDVDNETKFLGSGFDYES